MSNGLKALLIAASTIITCIVVTIGFQLAKKARQIGNQVTEELTDYQTAIAEQEDTKYDNVIVFGNDIVNLIKKRCGFGEGFIQISVVKGGNTVIFSSAEDAELALQKDNKAYLPPFQEYLGRVLRNKNSVIYEIRFTEQEKK